MSEPMKPCPFCGEVPAAPHCFAAVDPSGKWGQIACTGCGCYGPEVRTFYQKVKLWGGNAITEWNRREEPKS